MKLENALFSLIILLLISGTAAGSHMTLLAVSERNGTYVGSTADVYLLIRQGSGRVFVDTFPLMKLDTQISTRFAKEIACSEAGVSCSGLDFFYTIRSGSAIVGGPSASAAISAMTYSELKNLRINESIAITGTINAGGIIGPVDGVKEKIDAAAGAGITKVLIPEEENNILSIKSNNCTGNKSSCDYNVTALDYGKSKGVEVAEISTLQQAIYEITGKKPKEYAGNISVDKEYSKIMQEIASELCNETSAFLDNLAKKKLSGKNYSKEYESAKEFYNKSINASAEGNYYSSASYCFGANLKLASEEKMLLNLSRKGILEYLKNVSEFVNSSKMTERDYTTVPGFQTYMIVSSRISEAEAYVTEAETAIRKNDTTAAAYNLAYAEERIKSANLWKKFFKMPGKRFDFDKEKLKDVCIKKISEAEERYQYVSFYLNIPLDSINEKMESASAELASGEYESCFSSASLAKAQADAVLALAEMKEDKANVFIERRLSATEQLIMRETQEKRFPIAGFSYYEYAKSLKAEDPASAMLYSGYALELSNMDIYFQKKGFAWSSITPIISVVLLIFSGMIIGFITSVLFNRINKKKSGRRNKHKESQKKKR